MLSRLFTLLRGKPVVQRNPAEQRAVDAATCYLALYHFPACTYCVRVIRVIKHLGLAIELQDAHNFAYQQELRLQGGRYQTPCLRISGKDQAAVKWLYESADIIRYLEQRFTSD